jgi:hypothetical protein
MQRFILGGADRSMQVFDNNQGTLNQLQSRITNNLPLLSQQAFGPQRGIGDAQGYAQDVLGGKYLGKNNEYLDQMAGMARENAGNMANSNFSLAGRTGSGNHAERFGQGVANAENALRYQDYNAERDRMGQAASLLPSLAAAQYAGISPYLQATQTAANLPYAGLGALSPLLGAGSGAGSQTQNQPSDIFGQVLGAVGMALPFLSDERAKDNIELVGRLDSGLGLYEWDYKQGIGIEGRWRGVLAQEVAKIMPGMLGPEANGFMTVRYTPERVA